MGLHPNMKIKTKTGKRATIVEVAGNSIRLKRKKSYYWVQRQNLR